MSSEFEGIMPKIRKRFDVVLRMLDPDRPTSELRLANVVTPVLPIDLYDWHMDEQKVNVTLAAIGPSSTTNIVVDLQPPSVPRDCVVDLQLVTVQVSGTVGITDSMSANFAAYNIGAGGVGGYVLFVLFPSAARTVWHYWSTGTTYCMSWPNNTGTSIAPFRPMGMRGQAFRVNVEYVADATVGGRTVYATAIYRLRYIP